VELADERHDIAEARAELVLSLDRALRRLRRRVAAVRGDLARVSEAETLADKARWFAAEAARAPRGTRTLTIVDWSSGEPKELAMPLDPSRSAKEQVDAVFRRARRLRGGVAVAEERLAKTQATLEELRQVETAAGSAPGVEELVALARRAKTVAPTEFSMPTRLVDEGTGVRKSSKTKGRSLRRRLPYRSYLMTSGARILVGRSATDNDVLTRDVARPHDLWLHAKGMTGSHVVVPLDKGKDCPTETLIDAAHLAAHFSDARGESVVDVAYTPKRYVRKPRHAAPGLVVLDREKVIALRVDPERVARLLGRESME